MYANKAVGHIRNECFSDLAWDSAISGVQFWTKLVVTRAREDGTSGEVEVHIGNSYQRVAIQLYQRSYDRERRISIMNVTSNCVRMCRYPFGGGCDVR